jgi:energy-coupling factor transporter transmembrane protein EcfT
MTELSRLIARLQRGIVRSASYVKTIRHPHLLVASLQELNDLIGNDKVKDAVATQVSHLIMIKRRALENPNIKEDEVMLNTVLYGPPGVGKTLVGAKLAKIWYSLGYLDGSHNTKEKKQELGDILKDLFKDGAGVNGSGSTDDTALIIYVLFIFIVIFITLLSMAWSFYSKFGGLWTLIVIGLIIFVILAVGYYISSSLNNNSNKNNHFNKDQNKDSKDSKDPKDIKGTGCSGKDCPIDGTHRNSGRNNPAGIRNKNDTNEFGNSPVIGELPSDDQVIKVVTRADFVDKFVGWSDKKTIKLLEENLGKVVFVDEAYSLVTDMHDSFGMEVLTTINLFLSQHSKEIIVIFAGYKDLMETGIFSFQPGLRRRFMWQFDCNGYTEDQMFEIFKGQLSKKGWGLTDEGSTKILFHHNKGAFPAFGGDTERLAFFSELEHSRDFISNEKSMSINQLSPDHVRRGIAKLVENNIQSNPDEESTNPMVNMIKLFRGNKKQNNTTRLEKNQLVYGDQNNTIYSDKSEPISDDLDMINAIRDSTTDRAYH